ncbi:hypothetical protein M408DRAFT_327035 [Serendipita vermifera MAFF 305830]|uniref:Uncharacterized protein n=1 Tax=Serendipita vermifera MAFF 305830 TaxID=933852 RepID=A0A0C2XUC9_SERVB|nr:hypothetical protein M408DRAFT_327035 [Serendipita vermifera MAFF 305830]
MARTLQVRFTPASRRPFGLTASSLKAWNPALLFWGIGTGATLTLLLSNTPIFKKDVLIKLPVVGSIWVDDIHPEDKPF